jgi:hypothetical protein
MSTLKHTVESSVEIYSKTENEFPVHCFPENIRNMVIESADSLKLPVVVAATAALAALSSAGSKNLRVWSGNDRQTCGVLDIIDVMESGLGKSGLSSGLLQPIRDAEAELIGEWELEKNPKAEATLISVNSQIEVTRKKIDKAADDYERCGFESDLEKLLERKREAERMVIPPALYTEDCTSQELGSLAAVNNGIISSISAEAGDAIQNILGKWNMLKKTDDTLYLKGYSIEDLKVNRSTQKSFSIKEVAVNIFWLI